ncbi:hypothetical protein [Phytoactinopolyspora mesophila]|uniref:Uncharacterized protein n=1 Tax=Phytoactinopolyspora mesophila TaxID=2650750 RepID=A0A7K3MAB0_9ACTN|nr:hypothetical protein [Phytoactinopolyspora mesophila]NDL60239.1 hypothetical protein [Phytoactinopolyspora mesophila]
MTRREPKNDPFDTLTAWESADSVPRAGLPDARILRRRQRLFRIVVWTCIFGFPLAALGLMAAASSPSTSDGNEQPGPTHMVSDGVPVATAAVDAWLRSDDTPLPGGRIVAWLGSETVAPPETDEDGESVDVPAFAVEVSSFLVTVPLVDAEEMNVVAAVPVAVDPRGGAVAMSLPSIVPDLPPASDGWDSGGPWPGHGIGTIRPSDAMVAAVEGWARAFTSGDPSSLRMAVGDPDPTRVYVPMLGVESVEANVVHGIGLSREDDEVLAQVELIIDWAGMSPPDSHSSRPPTTVVDVLIERASTASPVVVAWGPAGSGPTLTRYGNGADAEVRDIPSGEVLLRGRADQEENAGGDETETPGDDDD